MENAKATVYPGIQLNGGSKVNKYRARKTVNGVRKDFYTNSITKAKQWLKSMV